MCLTGDAAIPGARLQAAQAEAGLSVLSSVASAFDEPIISALPAHLPGALSMRPPGDAAAPGARLCAAQAGAGFSALSFVASAVDAAIICALPAHPPGGAAAP